MATDLDPRRAPAAPPAPRRVRYRRGEQPAGRVLATMVLALGLAALVNADALVDRAESKPLGTGRDRSLAIWHPVQDVAHITQLHRVRQIGDWLVGNEDEGSTSVVPEVAPTTTVPPEAITRPVLRAPAAGAPLRVHLAGDSIMHDTGNAFIEIASGSPLFDASLHYENATGLTRPDFYDWPAALAEDMRTEQPEVLFLLFGGNDAQPLVTPTGDTVREVADPAWQAEYGRRVGAVMDLVRADDRLVFWIGLPPMRSAGFDQRAAIMSSVYREQAEQRPWVTYVDTVPLFGDDQGRYVDRLPNQDGDLVDVRKEDGVHFNAAGAERMARALLDVIDKELQAVAAG